jgi:hypothetical protein
LVSKHPFTFLSRFHELTAESGTRGVRVTFFGPRRVILFFIFLLLLYSLCLTLFLFFLFLFLFYYFFFFFQFLCVFLSLRLLG